MLVTVSGQGNLRKLQPPRLAGPRRLEDLRAQGRRQDRATSNGISGSKTVEYLLLPERAGDHHAAGARLLVLRSRRPALRHPEDAHALRMEVSGEGKPGGRPGPPAAAGGTRGAGERARRRRSARRAPAPALRRDLGTTLYRSPRLPLDAGARRRWPSASTVVMGRAARALGPGHRARPPAQDPPPHPPPPAGGRGAAATPASRPPSTSRSTGCCARCSPAAWASPSPACRATSWPRSSPAAAWARAGRPHRGRAGRHATAPASPPAPSAPAEMRASLERAAELILQIEKATAKPEPSERGRGSGRMKRLRRLAGVAAGCWPLAAGTARADLIDEAWKRGNDAYFRGDYAGGAGGLRAAGPPGGGLGRPVLQPGRGLLPAGATWGAPSGPSSGRVALEPEAEDAALQPGPGAQAGRAAGHRQD